MPNGIEAPGLNLIGSLGDIGLALIPINIPDITLISYVEKH